MPSSKEPPRCKHEEIINGLYTCTEDQHIMNDEGLPVPYWLGLGNGQSEIPCDRMIPCFKGIKDNEN